MELSKDSTSEQLTICIASDGERSSSLRLPDVLLVVVVLRDNSHLLSDKVGRVEAHTKLPNHGNIGSCLECLHESLQSVSVIVSKERAVLSWCDLSILAAVLFNILAKDQGMNEPWFQSERWFPSC